MHWIDFKSYHFLFVCSVIWTNTRLTMQCVLCSSVAILFLFISSDVLLWCTWMKSSKQRKIMHKLWHFHGQQERLIISSNEKIFSVSSYQCILEAQTKFIIVIGWQKCRASIHWLNFHGFPRWWNLKWIHTSRWSCIHFERWFRFFDFLAFNFFFVVIK